MCLRSHTLNPSPCWYELLSDERSQVDETTYLNLKTKNKNTKSKIINRGAWRNHMDGCVFHVIPHDKNRRPTLKGGDWQTRFAVEKLASKRLVLTTR
jgi:hypothetical protein